MMIQRAQRSTQMRVIHFRRTEARGQLTPKFQCIGTILRHAYFVFPSAIITDGRIMWHHLPPTLLDSVKFVFKILRVVNRHRPCPYSIINNALHITSHIAPRFYYRFYATEWPSDILRTIYFPRYPTQQSLCILKCFIYCLFSCQLRLLKWHSHGEGGSNQYLYQY